MPRSPDLYNVTVQTPTADLLPNTCWAIRVMGNQIDVPTNVETYDVEAVQGHSITVFTKSLPVSDGTAAIKAALGNV